MFLAHIILSLLLLYNDQVLAQMGSLRCGLLSRNKRTVLDNPAQLPTICSYTIEAMNVHVCQLLVQFERFTLQQPRLANSMHDCEDRLVVDGRIICGENAGQHLYVDFPSNDKNNANNRRRQITLTFELPNRWAQSAWRLVATQLECAHNSDLWRLSSLPGLGFLEGIQNTARNMFQQPNYGDLDVIAPPGCDQYYRQPTGTIRSFNYNATRGTLYMPHMKYVICVKSKSGAKEIEYNIQKFSMSIQSPNQLGIDADCHSSAVTLGRRADHIMIPESTLPNLAFITPTYYCGRSLENRQILASSPFLIYFQSDEFADSTETGFSIDYIVK